MFKLLEQLAVAWALYPLPSRERARVRGLVKRGVTVDFQSTIPLTPTLSREGRGDKAHATASCSSNLNISHLPIWRDKPALHRVVVIDRAGAAHLAQLGQCRLYVTG